MQREVEKYPIRIFRQDTKNKGEFRNQTSLRKKLMNSRILKCQECKRDFSEQRLYLDHIVPICLSGKQYDEINTQLLCKACHSIKTIFDKDVLFFAKRLRLIERLSIYEWQSYVDLDKLEELYWLSKKLFDEAKENNMGWV